MRLALIVGFSFFKGKLGNCRHLLFGHVEVSVVLVDLLKGRSAHGGYLSLLLRFGYIVLNWVAIFIDTIVGRRLEKCSR
jgi:hypothetical protein